MRTDGEFERIRAMLSVAVDLGPSDQVVIGPGDDAAVVRPAAGESIVLSTDLSIEGVHFRRDWLTWELIGYRAAGAALSDLAAMAARPIGVLVSLALPPELDTPVYEQITSGLTACLGPAGAVLLGGDTSRSPGPAMIDIVAVGGALTAVGRAGAGPGDEIWVTGRLGAAAAALFALRAGLEPDPGDRRKFERPEPRWREAIWLTDRNAMKAAIDLSDGLAGDVAHLAEASGVRVDLCVDRLPLATSLEAWSDDSVSLSIAAGGGEDYELLFAAPAGVVADLRGDFRSAFGLDLTRIGGVTEGAGVSWVDRAGGAVAPPASAGFDHFTDRA
ncbi:MAG: thiamine-phosphate kinase [Gemmatimonadota bacterium]